MKPPAPARTFYRKLSLYAALLLGFGALTVLLPWPLKLLPQLGLGAMFAHGIELEHELIHQKHFAGPGRRWVGTALGLPLLVDFTRYRVTHSHHHRALGTPDDEESFAYDFERLATPAGLVRHLSMVGHYRAVAQRMGMALRGDRTALQQDMGKAGRSLTADRLGEIQQGYVVFAAAIALAVTLSLLGQTTLALQLWAIPLLFASPIHALIELPEHWGCQTDTTDVMANTRTILPSRFMDWFTNGNCWHVEHHARPALPMAALPQLHGAHAAQIKYLSYGYGEFYGQFWGQLWAALGQRRAEA
jgi:fatty acid desaturase